MYTLSAAAQHRFTGPEEVYALDIHRTNAGLAAIASDQSLSLLHPGRVADGPVSSWKTSHGNITALRPFDAANSVVCTAGEDGTVTIWDLRQKSAVSSFKASDVPILSMACSATTQTIAVGTELQHHTASIHLWDARASTQKAHYQEVHSDDITELAFHPTNPAVLLSGSTDGLVNVYDTRITDEDELTVQTLNPGSSVHHAAFLTATEVMTLSHDEQFALYDVSEDKDSGDATHQFGDLRSVLGCQYVANVTPKLDGSGAVIGAGAQDKQAFELVFLARAGGQWALDRDNSVGLPGAHGEELVRAFCFFDDEQVVFTAGEDGCIKAWRP